jgi:molecular chaperone HtpG
MQREFYSILKEKNDNGATVFLSSHILSEVGRYCKKAAVIRDGKILVTDSVENIVPEFLTLLHGVIDSPDIPLNVSRSYLQSDANVKKISTYITKKVADRLDEIFRNERQQLEEKWDNLKLFIEFGMLSDEKFCERAMKFALLKSTEGKYFSIEDYKTAISGDQTDKDGKVVFLYATDVDAQYSFIEAAKNKGYDVLLMDCQLDSHFVQLLESKIENARFARVDSDTVDNLIPKEDKSKPELTDEQKEEISTIFKAALPEGNEYYVQAENLGAEAAPILITQSEFMRRYREMSAMGGGMNFYGEMPQMYNIIVNMENPLVGKILTAAESHKEDLAAFAGSSDMLRQITDLALLANGMLKGKDLSDFIARSAKVVEDAYL